MSQAGLNNVSSIPSVPLVFPTDINSPAVPVAHSLSVLGGFTGVNFTNGIATDGDSGSGNLYIYLTNRLIGTIGTSDGSTVDLTSFDLGATAGTFVFDVKVCAFNSSTPASGGYSIIAMLRTTGAAATLVGTPVINSNEEVALLGASVGVIASGNNAVFQVTGVVGLNINWTCNGIYTFGGA